MNLVNVQSNFVDILLNKKSSTNCEEENDSSCEFWVSERNIEKLEDITQISKIKVLEDGTCTAEGTDYEKQLISFKELNEGTGTGFIFKSNGVSYNICTPTKNYDFKAERDTNDGNRKTNVTSFDIFEDEWVIFGTEDGMVYLYSLVNNTCIKSFRINDMEVLECKFFPKGNGTVIVTVSFDYIIRIWNLEEEISDTQREVRKFTGHTRMITDLKFVGAVGRNFITSSKDGCVKLWECGSGSNLRTFNRIHKNAVNCTTIIDYSVEDGSRDEREITQHQLDFETEGKFVVFGDKSGSVSVYDLFNSYFVKEFKYQQTIQNETEEVVSLCSLNSEDHGLVIIAAFSKGTLRIIEYLTGNIIKELVINKGIPLNCVKAASNDSIIISSNNDTLIQLNINNYKIERYFASYGDYNTVLDCVCNDKKLYVVDNYDRKLVQFQL